MASRRTQPYRATAKRKQSLALHAMQRGRPARLRNPIDTRRAAMKRRKRRPRLPQQKPLARTLKVRRKVLPR